MFGAESKPNWNLRNKPRPIQRTRRKSSTFNSPSPLLLCICRTSEKISTPTNIGRIPSRRFRLEALSSNLDRSYVCRAYSYCWQKHRMMSFTTPVPSLSGTVRCKPKQARLFKYGSLIHCLQIQYRVRIIVPFSVSVVSFVPFVTHLLLTVN